MGNIADKLVFPLATKKENAYGTESQSVVDQVEWVENKESGYSIPLIKKRSESPRAVILYSHGNGEDMYSISEYIESVMTALEVDIWYWDYAGYGPHQFKDDTLPSQENVYSDIRRLTQLLNKDEAYMRLPKIVWGRSLGSAPSIHACVEYEDDLDGLIIESGFRSCVRVMQPTWVAASIHSVFDIFDNEKEIAKLSTVPVLIIHGKEDHIIPYEHSKHLLSVCKTPKEHLCIEHGTHNNIDSDYKDTLFESVENFISAL